MSETVNDWTGREAVAAFHDAKSLEAAIDELMSSGFDRAEIGLLAGDTAIEEKLGHLYEKVQQAEDDPNAPRIAYIAREDVGDAEGGVMGVLLYIGALAAAGGIIASGGTLAAAFAAAAAGGTVGGLLGASLARLVGEHHANFLEHQLKRGGILLWVRTPTPEREERALEILRRHSADDVHVHDLSAATG